MTKEELNLCRQIAKKHRKEIKYGDTFYSEYFNEVLLNSSFINPVRDKERIKIDKNAIPLWTIFDCLNFFSEQKYHFESLLEDDMCLFKVNILYPDRTGGITTDGGTVLGTLLKAVLIILEDEKYHNSTQLPYIRKRNDLRPLAESIIAVVPLSKRRYKWNRFWKRMRHLLRRKNE